MDSASAKGDSREKGEVGVLDAPLGGGGGGGRRPSGGGRGGVATPAAARAPPTAGADATRPPPPWRRRHVSRDARTLPLARCKQLALHCDGGPATAWHRSGRRASSAVFVLCCLGRRSRRARARQGERRGAAVGVGPKQRRPFLPL